MPPTSVLALSSVAESVILNRYAPTYSISTSLIISTLVLFLAQTLLSLTWLMLIYPHFSSPLRHLPHPKGGSLFMGHFDKIRKEDTGVPHREWMETVPNNGLIYYRSIFNSERVMLTSPKALAEVLVQKNYEFIKPPQMRHGIGRILGIGILLAEGDEHKKQRKALMPAFSFRHIKDLYPVFWNKAREVTETMTAVVKQASKDPEKPSSVLEVANWASRATLDIIGIAGMGKDFNAVQDPESELNAVYRTIFSPSRAARLLQMLGTVIPFSVLRFLPVKRNFEVAEAAATIRRITYDLIQDKKQRMKKGEQLTDVDILSAALESGGFTDEELVNQLMTFLAAGHETTAASLTWAAYLLCKHPEVQQRLRTEVRTNLPSPGKSNTNINSNDIDRLQYLNAVCNEVVRVHPPVPMTIRIAANDTSVMGEHIPKGTTIFMSPWAINNSRELWGDDAQVFNPDRWMRPGCVNTGGADSNYSFLTFLHGPRSCIGQSFAKAEFACLLAAWVGRFEMDLGDSEWKLEVQGGVTSRPKGGVPVRLTPVEGW